MMTKEITLLQAMTGVDFTIKHLDGSTIRIKNNPGEVIKPDEIKTIPDKGLPFFKQTYKMGNLYIVFKVTFPASIPAKQLSNVAQALSMQKVADVDMSEATQTVLLEHYDESKRNTQATGGQDRDEDSDEESSGNHGGAQSVRCAQQ